MERKEVKMTAEEHHQVVLRAMNLLTEQENTDNADILEVIENYNMGFITKSEGYNQILEILIFH